MGKFLLLLSIISVLSFSHPALYDLFGDVVHIPM